MQCIVRCCRYGWEGAQYVKQVRETLNEVSGPTHTPPLT
jgi:hypothetical protein